MGKIVIKEAPSSIGRGWFVSQSGEGGSFGIKTQTEPILRVVAPQCYLLDFSVYARRVPACPLENLYQSGVVPGARFSAPLLFAGAYHLGARASNKITLSKQPSVKVQFGFGDAVEYSPVALLENVGSGGAIFTNDPAHHVGAVRAGSFHFYNANNEDFKTTLTLPPYETGDPDYGVLFALGNLQADKLEIASNGDVIVYASLSSRIPRGFYSWTSEKEIVTEVYQENGEWKARGERLTVTAEIYGEHWT